MPARDSWIPAPLVLAALLVGACSTANSKPGATNESASASASTLPPPGRADTSVSGAPATRTDSVAPADTGTQAQIARLEREARAIAKTTGCNSASACRTAPVGARACGGPRTYLVYCAASTDTVALMARLHELERVEKAWNERSGMASTCEMRLPPTVTLIGGACREAPAKENRVP